MLEAPDDAVLHADAEWASVLFFLYSDPAIGRPCAERLEKLRNPQDPPWIGLGRELVAGTKRFVAGDKRGAVEAWRPLVADGNRLVERVPIEVFDAVGESALGESVDRTIAANALHAGHGATGAHPRMAKRAFARGDKEEARKLAQAVVDAWGDADVKVPAVAEMRELLRKLR